MRPIDPSLAEYMSGPWARSNPLPLGAREPFPDGMTRAAWLYYCGVAGPTSPWVPTEREVERRDRAIAIMESGECLWHAVSLADGRLDRCPCTPCARARKAV